MVDKQKINNIERAVRNIASIVGKSEKEIMQIKWMSKL